MIKIMVRSTLNEVISKIRSSIVLKNNPTDLKWGILCKEEFLGNISGNALWLQKTKSHIGRLPQRYFEGTLLEYDGYVLIQGGFKFTKGSKGAFVLGMLFISVWFFFFFHRSFLSFDVLSAGILKFGSYFLLLLMLWMVGIVLTFGAGALLFKKEEKEVIAFLNRL